MRRPGLRILRYNGDYRLAFSYDDGFSTELDFSSYLEDRHGPMVEPLADPKFFAQAFIDHGVLSWPNGYDVCPDILRAWCEAGRVLRREETETALHQSPVSG